MNILKKLFSRKHTITEIQQKRNFDNVSWEWTEELNGEKVAPLHIFKFENGLGVIVFKKSQSTWDGMKCTAICGIEGDKYKTPSLKGVYDMEGVGEQDVLHFCSNVKQLTFLNTGQWI